MKKFLLTFFLFFLSQAAPALAKTYDLEIKKQNVFITGKAVEALTVNGQIPGPTLYLEEGEDAVIKVKNSMNEKTSIHWHGILLPGSMDGVPGLNGFDGIAPGETFTYQFKVRQAGTYWYHSHSNIQEQQGLYGAFIIAPKKPALEKSDREYVILFSDFTEEDPKTILNNLKIDSGYYNYNKRTIFTFIKDLKQNGFSSTLRDYLGWNQMRMDPTDLSDVSRYYFLINGKTSEQNWSAIFRKGERVRLRFINASAMTIYDVSIPGFPLSKGNELLRSKAKHNGGGSYLKMKLVEADGQPVRPILIDEFRFGVAETYDVIVEPEENKVYTIFAEPIDRTGYARATLAPKEGMKGDIPAIRPRAVLTMADMGMDHGMEKMDHSMMNHEDHDMDKMKSGWADASTPRGHIALSYSDLVSLNSQKDLRQPTREIEFRFGGSMNRYIWTINGQKFPKPIHLGYGERVRLKFVNDTMMAHPIHLHGMFMQMENGQEMEFLPNKHTVIVPPAQTVSMLLNANEEGEWAFHCHLLYHMLSGMMTSLSVDKNQK